MTAFASTLHLRRPHVIHEREALKPLSRTQTLFVALLLTIVYGLLALTHTISLTPLMQKCVLADSSLSRIGGISSVLIGMAYGGVFGGMVWYFLRARKSAEVHLVELGQTVAHLQRQVAAREEAECENARLHTQLQDAAEAQRRFLRDVLASVTEGRLHYCTTREELPLQATLAPMHQQPLTQESLRDLRSAVRAAGDAAGLTASRLSDLVMATGEASMNAVVHGCGGAATVYADPAKNRVQVWVEDRGCGISLDSLPRATLELGYTTLGTLGHGFWMMLKTADHVYLMTSPKGTTVVLEQGQEPPDELAWARMS